jgi:geranylgeranylglycerol-phosphate geranylgeranyltransferase
MSGEPSRRLTRKLVVTFVRAYVKSMRPYYAFVTGIAGWIGVAFARYLYPESVSTVRSALVLTILFLSWGVNQIVNDWLGLKEDRINAPNRPMVTGELNIPAALTLSVLLTLLSLCIAWWISPWAAVPLMVGIILNVLYEYAKGIPFLGNVIFGVMLSSATAFGFLATSPEPTPEFTRSRVSVLALVAVMNGLMTYYTYFKDFTGDKLAGKITAVVFHGIHTSRRIALLLGPLPSLVLATLLWIGAIKASVNGVFVFLFGVTLFLQIWTGAAYFKHPTGRRAYESLVTNFRACTCGQVTLIALFNPELALYLYIATYVFVGFLFGLHDDHRS